MTEQNVTPLPVEPPPPAKPRLKKLRLLLILVPLTLLAAVSTVFGMMMAVASDLPDLEALPQVEASKNSVLFDAQGRKLATLTSNEGRILVKNRDISPNVRNAVIAIEDRRFYTNSGVDLRGIARALWQDIVRGQTVQGGSTITQQFVKNALEAQRQRTLLNKLREAAMAYHMTRKWSKEKILTEYLNTIYFGNGAYGIEAAARTYFGEDVNHKGCGLAQQRLCASELRPHEAALLAGIIASPSAFDPVAHPRAAKRRRNLVLDAMVEEGTLTPALRDEAAAEVLPAAADVRPPQLQSVREAQYFTSWVRQQLVDEFGARRAFEGGLRVTTTLDLDLQKQALAAVSRLPVGGPSAALVAIDNDTGEVRAMVGGRDYAKSPFNLATQGQRQPGSAFKPFILAEALRRGYGPGSVWPSRKREFTVPGTSGREKFIVNNFEDKYSGQLTLGNALTFSDNSVFAAAGIKVGTERIARLAERMGIRTPVSSNYAMTLGGLKQGVTPLDMAHAFETFATNGNRITGTLGTSEDGPVGIRRVERNDPSRELLRRNKVVRKRILPAGTATLATQLMSNVVKSGTGRRAQWGGFAAGKTGTTENYGDAWFVGFTDRFTVAVWVGYPHELRSMAHDYGGAPVEGGTWPAIIWHDFIVPATQIVETRAAEERRRKGLPPKTATTPKPGTVAPGTQTETVTTPSTGTVPKEGTAPPAAESKPATPAPAKKPAPAPTPAPAPQPSEPPPSTGGAAPTTGGTPPPQ